MRNVVLINNLAILLLIIFLFNFLFFILLLGCGVKGNPSSPASPELPSLIEDYPDIKIKTPLGDQKKMPR